jgi:hypothetical protein
MVCCNKNKFQYHSSGFPLKLTVLVQQMKIIYYMQWVLTEDVESQRKGIVGVFWWPKSSGITPTKKIMVSTSDSESDDPNPSRQHDGFCHTPGPRDHIVGARLFAGAPGRVAAIHICLPDKQIFHLFRSSLALGLDNSRKRIKVHTGKGEAREM